MVNLPDSLKRPVDVLMIDNFDSFTWNLYQSLSLLGVDVTVIRNDAISPSHLPYLDIKRLIISPGPGHPKTDSGISGEIVRFFTGKVPILGVCMGLEVVVDVFGGEIGYAGEIKHGKLSPIRHDGRGVFSGLPQSFLSTRYHSLSASIKTLPDVLAITAATEESGVIMGVRHRQFTIEAVQYHPESVLSEEGDSLLKNFLNLRGGAWDENPSARVTDLSLPPFPISGPSIPNSTSSQAKSNKLPTILEKIHTQRLKDIDVAQNTPGTSMQDLEALLSMSLSPPCISLVHCLRSGSASQSSPAPTLMAEIKRASPSKGPISLKVNAAQQALTYALAGASVVSVLTEPHWFKGSLLDMSLARQAISHLPNRPAILRKDFIVSEYQIAEARLHGADSVLLIVALLPPARLRALYNYAKKLGMEPLVEVNNEREMREALEAGAKVIGVNNRNLHNFEVDMRTTSRLAEVVKGQDVILCALSGISGPEDVKTYAQQGVQAILVGEALMRAEDPRSFIRELLGWPVPAAGETEDGQPPLVKICGILTVDEALTAAQGGADMLGLNFVPSSKRRVSLEVACRISHAIRERRTQVEAEISSTSTLSDLEKEVVENLPWFSAHASRLERTIRAGHARPQLVGVFQDQPLSYIQHIVASAQLDMVQLHGNEPLHFASHIPVPVIRVFHVDKDGKGVSEIARPGLHKFVLLDAMREDGLSGGSGKVVDWEFAQSIADAGEVKPSPYSLAAVTPSPSQPLVNSQSNGQTAQSSPSSPVSSKASAPRLPIILAGGLTPSNVSAAVERVKPWAVDVAGGVERVEGGGKDLEKVIAFVRAAKGLPLASRPVSSIEEHAVSVQEESEQHRDEVDESRDKAE